MTRIVALDCESNGLHGQVFAAAVSVQEDGREIGGWTARCPIVGDVDPWVAEHVLPQLEDVPVTHDGYERILESWRVHYARLKTMGYLVVCHIAWPVEARFLWDAHRDTPFSGPFPLLDVASILEAVGADPTSVDEYLTAKGIAPPAGEPHQPLYDARATAAAYWALCRSTSPDR